MSYILDALKKSEEERHQGQVPNLGSNSTLIHNPKSKSSLWPWAIAALLLLNVFFVGFWVLKENREPTQSADKRDDKTNLLTPETSSQADIRQVVKAQPVTPAVSSKIMSSSVVAPAEPAPYRAQPSMQTAEAVNQQPFGVAQPDMTSQRATQSELIVPSGDYQRRMNVDDPVLVEVASDADVEEAPLLITPKGKSRTYNGPEYKPEDRAKNTVDLSEGATKSAESTNRNVETRSADAAKIERIFDKPHSFQIQIPDMAFNSHIYTDTASSRRVMINNIYLREGQTFSGMRVEQITEEGIVLSLKGESFKMGVLRDWYSPR